MSVLSGGNVAERGKPSSDGSEAGAKKKWSPYEFYLSVFVSQNKKAMRGYELQNKCDSESCQIGI